MADRRSNQRALPRFHSPRSEAAGLWRQQLRESFRLSHAPAFMPPTPASSIDWNAINKEYNYFTGGSPAAADYSDVLDSDDQSTDMATPSAAGGPSPATSPRLPSPPPFPEVQIGPKSPTSGTTGGNGSQDAEEKARIYKNASRRVRPGTKSEDWLFGPPLIPLSEIDSSFQLQEHLKALYHHHTKLDQQRTRIPLTRETALILTTPPEGVDRSLWLYELCRLSVIETNFLIVAFFNDIPPCSAQTCPEMRASEWQYLCAVHDPPKSCCAIDYCCHTLDWAGNVLTSPKHFPSRLTLGNDATGGSQQGIRQLTNIFRRLYRMFAHAWFQHREAFWKVEGRKGLYIFFKTVCDYYNLIPEDNYTIPPEAEGLASSEEGQPARSSHAPTQPDRVIISKQDSTPLFDTKTTSLQQDDSSDAPNTTINTGATTRRHKHTPSTGSLVTTILEGEEDDAPASAPLTSTSQDQGQNHSQNKDYASPSSVNANHPSEDTHTSAVPALDSTSSSTALIPTPPPTFESTETEKDMDSALAHLTQDLGIKDISINNGDVISDEPATQAVAKDIEDDTAAYPGPSSTEKEADIPAEDGTAAATPTPTTEE
ncbi:MOB member 4, phocein [Varicellaria rhodocarpa]|nr:MOB member 4, phocein [Varicellaria rhodocarpa]